MKILQLSDPHVVASHSGLVRGRPALAFWQQALEQVNGLQPDYVLVTGDLCQDESWSGYSHLRDAMLNQVRCPIGLLAGNHDHPLFIKEVLGRFCSTAPADLVVQGVRLLLLDSHRSGRDAGWLGQPQLDWLQLRLADAHRKAVPCVVALHHPPIAIGHSLLDSMRLSDQESLRRLLTAHAALRAVLFGHIHQHWQGFWSERPDVPLLGCPSTLKSFQNVQPCPLNRAEDPGGRLLQLCPDGVLQHQVLRWSPG